MQLLKLPNELLPAIFNYIGSAFFRNLPRLRSLRCSIDDIQTDLLRVDRTTQYGNLEETILWMGSCI